MPSEQEYTLRVLITLDSKGHWPATAGVQPMDSCVLFYRVTGHQCGPSGELSITVASEHGRSCVHLLAPLRWISACEVEE